MIKLKLQPKEIEAISDILEYATGVQTHEPLQRAWLSIGQDLADKFFNKKRKAERQLEMFDKPKKNSISLKYHEAYALTKIITYFNDNFNALNDLHRALLDNNKNVLMQKML